MTAAVGTATTRMGRVRIDLGKGKSQTALEWGRIGGTTMGRDQITDLLQ